MADENRIEIAGTLIELDALRFTPAGVPVVRFRIRHESTQLEDGTPRKIGCEISGLAFEREAKLIAAAALGTNIIVRGFIDRKSRNSTQLMLHATRIEFRN